MGVFIAQKRIGILTNPLPKSLAKQIKDFDDALCFTCTICLCPKPIDTIAIVVKKEDMSLETSILPQTTHSAAISETFDLNKCNDLILSNESYQYCIDCVPLWIKLSQGKGSRASGVLDLTRIQIPLSTYELKPLTPELFQDKFQENFEQLSDKPDLLTGIKLRPLMIDAFFAYLNKNHKASLDNCSGPKNKKERRLLNSSWKLKLASILEPLIHRAYIKHHLDSSTHQSIRKQLHYFYEDFHSTQVAPDLFKTITNLKWLELVTGMDQTKDVYYLTEFKQQVLDLVASLDSKSLTFTFTDYLGTPSKTISSIKTYIMKNKVPRWTELFFEGNFDSRVENLDALMYFTENARNKVLAEAIKNNNIFYSEKLFVCLLEYDMGLRYTIGDVFKAIALSRLNVLYAAYDQGLDLDQGQFDRYLLDLALGSNINDAIEFLIRAGVNLDRPCLSQSRPLSLSADRGYSNVLQLLIKFGADIKLAETEDYSPLFLAAHRGHLECVSILINNGSNVNFSDSQGVTPLLAASLSGHEGCVKRLTDAGANTIATEALCNALRLATK